MDFYISKNLLGTPTDLSFSSKENKFNWRNHQPGVDWVFEGDKEFIVQKNLASLLATQGRKEVKFEIPKNLQDAINSAAINIPNLKPNWYFLLKKEIFSSSLKKFVGEISNESQDVQTEYYEKVFDQTAQFLDKLFCAKINKSCFDKAKLDPTLQSPDTFRSNLEGFIKKVEYNRFSTRTGRLTVKSSSPHVLTLPKKHRNIFVSRFPGGKVVQLDYTSLETRLALILADLQPPPDVYDFVREKLFKGEIERKLVKDAVIAYLYGMKIEGVGHILKLNTLELPLIMASLDDFFKSEEIIRKFELDKQAKSGYIKNYYGRRIAIDSKDSEKSNIILNSFIQSTAVDISLLGFSKVASYLEEKQINILPLFVIHDSLILDSHPDCFSELENLKQVGSKILGFEEDFHLKIEGICGS